MKYIHVLIAAALLFACTQRQTLQSITDFSALLAPEPKDGGFRMQDYWVWSAPCIETTDFYLYASHWPKSVPFMQGYVFYSEIVRAVSKEPAGPYEFRDIALPVRGREFWGGRRLLIGNGLRHYLFAATADGPGGFRNADHT